MFKLRRVSKRKQQNVLAGVSRQFITNMITYFCKIREKPHLVKHSKHQRQLRAITALVKSIEQNCDV